MKPIVFGVVIGVCTFVAGVGLDRLIAGVYSSIWPQIPVVDVAPDLNVYDVEICELLREPDEYYGKIVRLKVARGIAGGTILGLVSSRACSGFIRTECPADGTCDLLPNLVGRVEAANADVAITGRFRMDYPPNDHAIEVQEIVRTKTLLECPDGSKVEEGVDCPVHNYIDHEDLRINGVGVGSSYKELKRALGTPLRTVKGPYHEVAGEREVIVKYDGLEFDMLYAPEREVVRFRVTSRKWDVSGIRVGDEESVLRSRFGSTLYGPTDDPDEKGVYTYSSEAGFYVTFRIRNGKIIEIWAAWPTC